MPNEVLTMIAPIVVGFIVLAITLRLVAGQLDRSRIRNYIAQRGGTVLGIHWRPFGPGWFAEQSQRIYRLRYRDADGELREAFVKTSMLTGVYLNDDHPREGRSTTSSSDAESENARLRARVRRLEAQLRTQHGIDDDA